MKKKKRADRRRKKEEGKGKEKVEVSFCPDIIIKKKKKAQTSSSTMFVDLFLRIGWAFIPSFYFLCAACSNVR